MVSFSDCRFLIACAGIMAHSLAKPKTLFWNLLGATVILWIAYGIINLSYIVAAVSTNIFLILLFRNILNEYMFIALNISSIYLYKSFGCILEPRIGGTFDISGFLMILTIKMSYISREFTKAKKIIQDKDKDGLGAMTKLLLEYIFFAPGLLSGPMPTLVEFTMCDRYAPRPFPVLGLLKTLVFLGIYAGFRTVPFRQWILSKGTPYMSRLVFLYLYNVVQRAKFHYIWNYSNCCFLLYNFNDQLNISFWKVEFTESVREISTNWNRYVNRWLRDMFLLPFRKYSLALSLGLCYTFSALLHGPNPCYLLFTFAFGGFSLVISRVNRTLRPKFIRQLQMFVFVSFFSIPFYLLDLTEVYRIWRAVGFIGLVYCLGLLAFFGIKDLLSRPGTATSNKKLQ